MKRISAVFLILPAPAFAHAGQHQPDFLANLGHLLTEPDHLIMLAAAAAITGLLVYLRKAGKL